MNAGGADWFVASAGLRWPEPDNDRLRIAPDTFSLSR
jgi:hypothetical protein